MTTEQKIFASLVSRPGQSQLELAQSIFGTKGYQQQVNSHMRKMVATGEVTENRSHRPATYTVGQQIGLKENDDLSKIPNEKKLIANVGLTEDAMKQVIRDHLVSKGFTVKVAFGRERGIDIEASAPGAMKIIEVKGCGSRPQMRVNYFLAILGETLQRMGDPFHEYWIALPNLPQYRGLWERLPALAKSRTGIRAMFVNSDGTILELD